MRGLEKAVIDEVQRLPELLLPIKQSVDQDKRPGRFLLTGSANLMTLPRVADSLAGRMSIIRLFPLSQSELRSTQSSFLDQAFRGKPPQIGALVLGADLIAMVLAGGYPEALQRSSWIRRRDWHLDYVESIIQRDVRDIADVGRLRQMPRLLRILAQARGAAHELFEHGCAAEYAPRHRAPVCGHRRATLPASHCRLSSFPNC